LLGLLAVVVMLVRGVLNIASWAYEEYVESRWLRRRGGEPDDRHPAERPRETPHPHEPRPAHAAVAKPKTVSEVTILTREAKPSRMHKVLTSLVGTATGKGYDYWVAAALAESDWNAKVKYLSKALRLNPTYVPALGLQANALLHLKRYEEAMQCFGHCLELHPSAAVFYKKGLCLYHLKRPDEAMACFDRAIETCTERERELLEEASHMRDTLAAEMRGGATT